MSSSLITKAITNLDEYIQNTEHVMKPGKLYHSSFDGESIQAYFYNGNPNEPTINTRHRIDVEQRNETLVIMTWVVTAEENYGFNLDDVVVENLDSFVPTIIGLREKVTKKSVQEAFQTHQKQTKAAMQKA